MRGLLTALVVIPALLAAILIGEPASSDSPPPVEGWLVLPAPPNRVSAPRALAVGNGLLYTFGDKGWIRIYDYEGHPRGERRLVRTIRGFPNGAALEPEGTLLVADSHESRLLRVARDGEKRESFGRGLGSEPGQFVYPQRIAIVGDRAYVTEYGYRENCRVQVFARTGEFLFTFGTWGTDGPHLKRPAGIAAGPDGRIYVADASHRVLVWSPEGDFLFDFGGEGKAPGRFTYPWGVATDDRYVYVSEYGNHRISRFTRNGGFAGVWGGPDLFRFPRDLAIADGWLFVADTGKDRIVRMKKDAIPWSDSP